MRNSALHRRGKRVTLGDVARAAGVSVMTVSNVINDRYSSVSPETLRRVQREIKRLKYRPHQAARSLRLARNSTIGMVIVHESHTFMAAPFVALMISGLTNALAERGYNLIAQGVHASQFGSAAVFQRVAIDGVVAHLAGADRDRTNFQKQLKATGTPVVLIQDHRLVKLGDSCVINQEDFIGGRQLAGIVLTGGARRLLFVKPRLDWPAVNERERGILAAAEEHGAALQTVSTDDEGLVATQQALRAHFDRNGLPEAILGSNDHLAIAAMKLVQSMGLKVPDDVAITGYNDFEYRTYIDPPLTTVRSNPYEMGERAGIAMVERLTTGRFAADEIVFPVSLVLGGSTRGVPPLNRSAAPAAAPAAS